MVEIMGTIAIIMVGVALIAAILVGRMIKFARNVATDPNVIAATARANATGHPVKCRTRKGVRVTVKPQAS